MLTKRQVNTKILYHALCVDNVCNRRLFSFPSKVEMAEEQEYLKCIYFLLGLPVP